MTKFIGGFAQGAVLGLSRSPMFLRVTRDAAGKIDALDQVADTPRADEQIQVYELFVDEGGLFVDGRDRTTGKRTGGFRKIATYTLLENQPDEKHLRENSAWVQWCKEKMRAGELED